MKALKFFISGNSKTTRYNHSSSRYIMLAAVLVLVPILLSAIPSRNTEGCQQSCQKTSTKSQEARFQKFLGDFPQVLNNSGKEVLIVVPTSGCPRGIEWAIDFYQKNESLNHDRVKNMIVSENPFIYAQSPLPEILSPDFQGNLSNLRNLGFYPNAPQIAFMEDGNCTKFVGVNCRPDTELASEIKDFLAIPSFEKTTNCFAGNS